MIAVAALVLAGCSNASEPPASSGSAATDAPAPQSQISPVDLTPALDHLHGLHVDTRGAVLAGTHTGLFEIDPSGRNARVGASDDDLMGLAGVPLTDTLYSSGHPGPSSSAPNPLGLNVSVDGGRSWVAKSLSGEVDFHALAADDALLVGFDGTSGLRVSTDQGVTWARGAALPVASLAISADGVWAVTPDGLVHSTDAARSFTAVADAPSLVLVSAGADGSLWGVDDDGAAWRSDRTREWTRVAQVGKVEALVAVGYDRAYAATARSLYPLG